VANLRIPGFLTTEQAAIALKLKEDTVRRYCHRKVIAAKKLGTIYLIPDSAILEFRRHRRGPGNPNFSKN